MDNITLKTFGIKLEPPVLLLNYETNGKCKQLVVPIRNFNATSNVNFVARSLKEKHAKLRVPLVLIEKMLKILQATLQGLSLQQAVARVKREYSAALLEAEHVRDDVNMKSSNNGRGSKTESDVEANSSTKTEDFW